MNGLAIDGPRINDVISLPEGRRDIRVAVAPMWWADAYKDAPVVTYNVHKMVFVTRLYVILSTVIDPDLNFALEMLFDHDERARCRIG